MKTDAKPKTRDYQSASSLLMAEQCPLKYELTYINKPETAPADINRDNLDFGTVMHNTAEDSIRACVKANYKGPLPLDRMVALFHRKFSESGLTGVGWFATGEKMAEDWARRMGVVDFGAVVVGVEVKFDFVITVDGQDIRLLGYIDRVDRVGPGHYRVVDYKTNRMIPSREEVAEHLQLSIYDLAIRHLYPDARVVDLELDMLRHGLSMKTERTAEQRETLKHYISAIVTRMDTAKRFPAKLNNLCGWCKWRAGCTAYKEATSGEYVPIELAGDIEGLVARRVEAALVAKLATAEKDAISKRLKTMLLQSERESVETEAGTARVWDSKSYKHDFDTVVDLVVKQGSHDPGVILSALKNVDSKALKRVLDIHKAKFGKPAADMMKVELEAAAKLKVTQKLGVK
jgi:hypothetical protein